MEPQVAHPDHRLWHCARRGHGAGVRHHQRTVENSLKAFFSQTAGDADVTIASSDQGQTFRARVLRQAEEFPGVALAVGSLWRSGTVRLADKDRDIALVGIDPAADPQVRRYKLAGGRMMDEADRIYTLVLVKTFADDNDIHLGDDLEIDLGERRVETFQVTGLLENEGAARSSNGAIGFLRLDIAQTLFDEKGRLSQVDVVASPAIAADGAALDRFKEGLGAALGDDYTVAYPAAVGQAVNDSMASLRSALGIFSTIALFVGAMLIYNTFTMTVAERTAEIGMLRAVGATRWQILRLVLIEAALMGFLGSVPGLGLGAFLAIPMLANLRPGIRHHPAGSFSPYRPRRWSRRFWWGLSSPWSRRSSRLAGRAHLAGRSHARPRRPPPGLLRPQRLEVRRGLAGV